MIVHVYTMVHNEEALMPYFMRHYGRFAQQITVLDNESSDRTAAIARDAGAVVFPVDTGGQHRVSVLQRVMNWRYKESRGKADWVICAEGDEFLWHPDLPGLLDRYSKEGVTLPKVTGFDMVAAAPPQGSGQVYEELKHGFPNIMFGKRAIFHPSIDIRFDPGGHKAFPTGPVVESVAEDIKLLHYRYLGEEYFVKRYQDRRARHSEENLAHGWGAECLEDHRERYRRELSANGGAIEQVVP